MESGLSDEASNRGRWNAERFERSDDCKPVQKLWSGQISDGSVPAMNASRKTLGHPAAATLPVSLSMLTNARPSGESKGTLGRPARARIMNVVQMGSAACVPVR